MADEKVRIGPYQIQRRQLPGVLAGVVCILAGLGLALQQSLKENCSVDHPASCTAEDLDHVERAVLAQYRLRMDAAKEQYARSQISREEYEHYVEYNEDLRDARLRKLRGGRRAISSVKEE